MKESYSIHFSSVQSFSGVWLFATPWTAARQASLSITNPQSPLKLVSICWWCHQTISSSMSPSLPIFNLSQHQGLFQWVRSSHQVAKVLEFQLQHQSSNEYSGLIYFRMDWLDLLAVQGTFKSLLQHYSSKASILHTHTHIHQEITKREMEYMNRIKNELPNTSNNTNTGRPPLNNDIKSTVPRRNMEQDQSWIEKWVNEL